MVGIQKGAGDNFVVGALVKVRGMVTEWQGRLQFRWTGSGS